MAKFQTAQERTTRIPHDFDPSAIFQLHDDPITDVTELIVDSFGDPESILIALEELAQESYLDQEDTRYSLEQMAPTTTNIQDKDKSPMARACHEWRHV
tara:strand:- start:1548 stop:1844 length:297 start_codon:yes stop_codon:yes gene_type:complete